MYCNTICSAARILEYKFIKVMELIDANEGNEETNNEEEYSLEKDKIKTSTFEFIYSSMLTTYCIKSKTVYNICTSKLISLSKIINPPD
jgi:hypothetical protein